MNRDITGVEILRKAQQELESWVTKQNEAAAKAQELEKFIGALQMYLHDTETAPAPLQNRPAVSEFANVSLRSAIKIVLQRTAGRALTSAEITDKLREAGMTSKAADFRSNVSATLSVMQSQYREVTRTEQGWILSQASSKPEAKGEAA